MNEPGLHRPVPICRVDSQEGEADRPAYVQVSRGPLVLQLSSHHGAGTPGTAVLVETDDVQALHAELHAKNYPFPVPGSRLTG
jgi:hypothetical protein